jgi:hypothetical protein
MSRDIQLPFMQNPRLLPPASYLISLATVLWGLDSAQLPSRRSATACLSRGCVSTPILGRDGIGRYHPTCVSGKDKTFVGLRRSSRYARTQDTATNPPLAYLRSAIRQAPSDRQSIGDIWQSTYGQMPQDSPSSERHLCPHGMHLLHAYVLRSTSRQPIASGC